MPNYYYQAEEDGSSLADKEDKAHAKYESTHNKNHNSGCNNNGGSSSKQQYTSTPNRKHKPDNTIATME